MSSGRHYNDVIMSTMASQITCLTIVYSIIIPPLNKVVGGYIGFAPSIRPSVCPSVRPSVRPASRVCSVAPTVLVWSISYLHILPNSFRCVACKVFCKIWIFGSFFKICSFHFVLFWHGIWCESLVWVIMGGWGVVGGRYLRTQAL